MVNRVKLKDLVEGRMFLFQGEPYLVYLASDRSEDEVFAYGLKNIAFGRYVFASEQFVLIPSFGEESNFMRIYRTEIEFLEKEKIVSIKRRPN